MQNFTKCAATRTADTVVLKLLDERDPADAQQHARDLTAAFWRDMGDLARARYTDAEVSRLREVAIRSVQELRLQRAIRAGTSYGSGTLVPLAQIYRLHGVEFPA